jgi:hypothetical protein
MQNKKEIEKICNNCLLYDRTRRQCKIAVLLDGNEYHMPVDPGDKCHIEELGIEIKQVRWWVEDESGNPTSQDGTVKVEYPEDFFGNEQPVFKE